MMFLVSVAVFVATAFAQNPFTLLPIECAIAFPQCVVKAGFRNVDDLNSALTSEAAYYAIFPDIIKCLLREKFGNVGDEVYMDSGYACGPLVMELSKILNDKTPRHDDPGCRNSCANTLILCGKGENTLSMTPDAYAKFSQCLVDEGVKEEGCCECERNCPDLPEDEAKDICNDASVSEDACSTALKPYYGVCSYHKNNKMKKQAKKCKLHTFWKGNCASLNRRLCTIAVKVKACAPVQKDGKKKYKRCAEF